MNIRLLEHSSDYLSCHIKGKAKQANALMNAVQSVLCEDAVCLKKGIVVGKCPLQTSVEQLSSNCCCLCKGVNSK